jgi:hypothetical protein
LVKKWKKEEWVEKREKRESKATKIFLKTAAASNAAAFLLRCRLRAARRK